MKVFASDLDGTLLNKDYQSDERIHACIQSVVEHGYPFVIVTGRTIHGIANLDFVKYASYSIVMNGAVILDRNFNVLHATAIDADILKAIYDTYRYDNVEYISDQYIYMTISKERYLKEYAKWELWQKKMSNQQLDYFLSIYKFDCKLEDMQNIVKINILEMDSDKYKEKEHFILNFQESLNNQPFDPHVLELTSKNISKLNALKYLCDFNHWLEDDCYIFGDGGNDVEMLKYFKHTYAPENASSEAKNAAMAIIESNSDYGVCKKMLSLIDNEISNKTLYI